MEYSLQARPSHRTVFLAAISLLVACTIGTAWILFRIYDGEKWVRHTYDIQIQLGEIESDLSKTGRERQLFRQDHDLSRLNHIEETKKEALGDLVELKAAVADNADQLT